MKQLVMCAASVIVASLHGSAIWYDAALWLFAGMWLEDFRQSCTAGKEGGQ